MAADYTVLANQLVTEFLPPNKTRQVHEITAQADPSGIVFYLRFVDAAYTTAIIARDVGAVAGELNKNAKVPGVAGIRIEQDIDANGQIVEYGIVTVESTSGDSSTELRAIQTWIYASTFEAKVAAARDKLDAIEAL